LNALYQASTLRMVSLLFHRAGAYRSRFSCAAQRRFESRASVARTTGRTAAPRSCRRSRHQACRSARKHRRRAPTKPGNFATMALAFTGPRVEFKRKIGEGSWQRTRTIRSST
jgi:hypothetical protein